MSRSYGNTVIIFQCLRKLPSSAKQCNWVQSGGKKPWTKPLAGGPTEFSATCPCSSSPGSTAQVDGSGLCLPVEHPTPMKGQDLPRAMGIASRAAEPIAQHQLLCLLCAETLPECWHFNSTVPSLHMICHEGITGCINVILDNNILFSVGFLAPYVPLRENSIPITPALAPSLKAINLGH